MQGAEGLLVNAAEHFTIENLAIEDTKGDGLKANGCKDLTIRNVRVEWTGGPDEKNGAYGLYPVQCEHVLIEKSAAIGASDAGIYVGQSTQIVLRDNRAEMNVAGIEIENSTTPTSTQHRHQQHRRHPGVQPARPAGEGRAQDARLLEPHPRQQHRQLRAEGQHRRDRADRHRLHGARERRGGVLRQPRREQSHGERADPVVRQHRQAGERRGVRSVSAAGLRSTTTASRAAATARTSSS